MPRRHKVRSGTKCGLMTFIGPRSALKLLETFTTYIFEHIYEGAWQLIICQPFVDIHTKVLSLRNHKGRSMVFLTNGGEAMLTKRDILTIYLQQQNSIFGQKDQT